MPSTMLCGKHESVTINIRRRNVVAFWKTNLPKEKNTAANIVTGATGGCRYDTTSDATNDDKVGIQISV